jgi:hypothetical protein
MEAQRTKVHLVHAALLELGLPPRYAIDDVSDQGATIDIQFPRCVARTMGLHDWYFCRRKSKPPRLSAAPENGFRYGFELPGDRLGVPLKVLDNPNSKDPLRDIFLAEDFIYANCPDIWLYSKVKRDPRDWDDQFADAFCISLASMLAVPLIQDMELAEAKRVEAHGAKQFNGAGGMFGRLIAQHRAGEPVGAGLYENDPLTSAHGGSWSGRI